MLSVLVAAGEVINIQNRSEAAQLADAATAAGQPRPRAAMVILARDQDLDGVLLSMGRLEARFNNSQYRCSSCSTLATWQAYCKASLGWNTGRSSRLCCYQVSQHNKRHRRVKAIELLTDHCHGSAVTCV